MALCPKCGKPVEVKQLFCSAGCKKKYKSAALPLAYRVELEPGQPVKLLCAVLKNIYHSPAAAYRMRRGMGCDPTGIICELSGLGDWHNLGGGLWIYQTTSGGDYLTLPDDVLQWSGLSHADVEKLQHSYDRKAGRISSQQRVEFAEKVIGDIIASYEHDKQVGTTKE